MILAPVINNLLSLGFLQKADHSACFTVQITDIAHNYFDVSPATSLHNFRYANTGAGHVTRSAYTGTVS